MGLRINEFPDRAAATSGAVAQDRVYRTGDGALVAEGDPRAAFLAYPVGEPVADADLAAYRALTGAKAARRPADKAASKPADK